MSTATLRRPGTAETRQTATGLTAAQDGKTIALRGLVIRYGAPYEVTDRFGSFTETMHSGVASRVMARPDFDCRFLINHDGLALARSASGTLVLDDGPVGLSCIAYLDSRSASANELALAVERGDVNQMSCGFVVGEDSWGIAPGGVETRDVFELAELFDCSAVTFPASPTTSIELASRVERRYRGGGTTRRTANIFRGYIPL